MQTLSEDLYSAAQVREMERYVIEQKDIAGIELMRNAGLAVFELIRQHYFSKPVTVICGAGNNAGDGYVVAELALQAKVQLQVFYVTDPAQLSGDALLGYQRFVESGGVAQPFSTDCCLSDSIIVDALLGTGLNREITGAYASAIQMINDSICKVVAIDIPSGLHADTGNVMGVAVKANHTVSFIGLKQGLYTGFAVDHCGQIHFSALNVSADVYQQVVCEVKHITHCQVAKRQRSAHKGHFGHVLLVGGDHGYAGAIRLAAEAALRSGAGLVTVATRVNHLELIYNGRPEIMCHAVTEAEQLSALISKASVVVVGPGLGQGEWGKAMLQQVLVSDKSLVMDADALNLLAEQHVCRENWVLTPHPGECARLLNQSTLDIAQDRFASVQSLQHQYGGVAVLKGAGSLICNGQEIAISTTGNPGMATGGMGDVLAGLMGGLVAQKLSLYNAALTAVFFHGKAADMSAQNEGERGLLASDLMPYIRQLVNT